MSDCQEPRLLQAGREKSDSELARANYNYILLSDSKNYKALFAISIKKNWPEDSLAP